MLQDRIARWVPVVMLLSVGAALVASNVIQGGDLHPATAGALAAIVVGGWWLSPARRGRHVSHERAQAASVDEDLIVYWKPGCSHCIRLLTALDRRDRDQIRWVNVWQDDDAATFVADHNHGNVLTPTVVTGAGHRLPMTAEAIRSHLADQEGRPRRRGRAEDE